MCVCVSARTLGAYRKTTFNHCYLSSSLFGDIVQASNTYGGKNLLWVWRIFSSGSTVMKSVILGQQSIGIAVVYYFKFVIYFSFDFF